MAKNTALLLTLIPALLLSVLPVRAQDGAALMEAVMYQDVEEVKKLVQNGVDIDYQDDANQTTALMLACNYGLVEIAAYLVEQGADLNLQNKQGHTALIAAAGRSRELVEMLLRSGADVHAKAADGTTALTASVVGVLSKRVSTDVVEILLDAGADVNESAHSGRLEGYTCLMTAAQNNRPDLVRFLLGRGADPTMRAGDGNTALSLARENGDGETAALLMESGAAE